MTATSWQSLLVVASSRMEAIAGRLTQRSLSTVVGFVVAELAELGPGSPTPATGGMAAAANDIGGPVDESTKYGNPIVPMSSSKIRMFGSPATCSFQLSDGAMGSSASESASSTRCRITWRRGVRYLVEKCA